MSILYWREDIRDGIFRHQKAIGGGYSTVTQYVQRQQQQQQQQQQQ